MLSMGADCTAFQFALPRGERRRLTPGTLALSSVSIRAPARGATHRRRRRRGHIPGFNSRSREGSDAAKNSASATSTRFQFALPRGERLAHQPEFDVGFFVSIRAPARGATTDSGSRRAEGIVSIRAPARGATMSTAPCTFSSSQFQFALPRGERPSPPHKSRATAKFQFALPRGERHHQRDVVRVLLSVSIRAPARGATQRQNFAD